MNKFYQKENIKMKIAWKDEKTPQLILCPLIRFCIESGPQRNLADSSEAAIFPDRNQPKDV